MSNNTLLYIAGPTAVGKTALSLSLAQHFDTEILSCDSRQFYSEMSIGTAVPTIKERERIPHHFIQHQSIQNPYTVGDYEREALQKLESLFSDKKTVLLVGGSGLYADALMYGIDSFPEVPKEVRKEMRLLFESQGIEALHQLLKEKDPVYYQQVDLNNPVRLLRALEVCVSSSQPYSSFLKKTQKPRPFKIKIICIKAPRSLLYERINVRVDTMVTQGLVEEVKKLLPYKDATPLRTVGYQELFPFIEGKTGIDEALELVKRNSRRYAKRQITWFNKYDEALRIPHSLSSEKVIALLEKTWQLKRN